MLSSEVAYLILAAVKLYGDMETYIDADGTLVDFTEIIPYQTQQVSETESIWVLK